MDTPDSSVVSETHSPSPVPVVPPPLPAPDYPGSVMEANHKMYNWVEVTKEFQEATSELALGELLHDDLFGLFEAMSAIEMMDPKMDAGMRCNRQERKPFTFRTGVEAGHVVLKGATAAQLVGVTDATLACLVTWLEGHSLAQTVFTNLYLHSVHEIEDPPMKAFSVAVLKLVSVVKEIVAKGNNVYEEEDFQPASYNFSLCPEVSEQRCGGMLREVEDEAARQMKKKGDKTSAEYKEAKAVHARAKFLRLFYAGLCSLFRSEMTEGNRSLLAAREQLDAVEETVELGIKAAEAEGNLMGFDRLVNQRLMPPTFPRYTETGTREGAVAYFRGLVDRLVSATSVTQIHTFHNALEFFVDYSSSCPCCVLSRSVLQVLYQPLHNLPSPPPAAAPPPASNATASSGPIVPSTQYPTSSPPQPHSSPRGSPQLQDLLRDACKTFIAPPALIYKTPPYSADQIKECISSFFTQCCRPMGWLLQTFGHNRARQRVKIAVLLEEFAAVQEEADKLDSMLNAVGGGGGSGGGSSDAPPPPPSRMLYFSTWLLYHVLRLMVRYLLSGFELELYSVHEYPYLYWYLYELLYPWLTTCLHRADTCLVEYEQNLEAQKLAGKNKKKAKSQSKKKGGGASTRPYAKEITLCQAYTQLCSGFFKVTVGLKREKKILIPCSTFDDEGVRYEHRFAPFQNLLTPPLMPYGQFLEVYEVNCNSTPADLYLSAATDFGRARQIFESVSNFGGTAAVGLARREEDLKSLIGVAKNNLVVASILARDAGRKVDFDFAPHSTFPTLKLV